MPLKIIRQDITKLKVDAIVNTTNPSFDATGGLDHYIHQQAGNEQDENCRRLKRLEVGQACLISGYNLSTYIIHTCGPVWRGGHNHEEEKLRSCYLNSLELASQYQLNSIAFPLISTGTNQYPKQLALKIATNSIVSFLYIKKLVSDAFVDDIERTKKAGMNEHFSKPLAMGKK